MTMVPVLEPSSSVAGAGAGGGGGGGGGGCGMVTLGGAATTVGAANVEVSAW